MLESRTSFVITVFVVISKIENILLIVSPVVHRVYLYKSITMNRENNEKKNQLQNWNLLHDDVDICTVSVVHLHQGFNETVTFDRWQEGN